MSRVTPRHAGAPQPRGALPRLVTLLMSGLLLSACGEHDAGRGGDFAVLAQADEAFDQARRDRSLVFPEDHGPHPGFRIEWWYLTANLEDETGRPWGVQWTLFRTAMQPPGAPAVSDNPWHSPQVWMAHFAVTSPETHRAFQRYARGGDHGGVRQAGAQAAPFKAWLDDWRLESSDASWLPLRLQAAQGDMAIDLRLDSDRGPVLQGEAGYSQKHPAGGGSHYYSQPWLEVAGTLRFDGEAVRVTGQAWLDREWSSQFLQPDQQGWDWFALHLDDGAKLMAFQLRSRDGPSYRHAVHFAPDGSRRTARDWSLEPLRRATVAGRRLPLAWRLHWPDAGLNLVVEAGLDDQWMNVDFPYWEGRVVVRNGEGDAAGVGYLEMTGYGAGKAH